jgi:ankyrin repeat protein
MTAVCGYIGIIKALIANRNIDVGMEDFNEGQTAFHIACRFDNLKVVKMIASHRNIDVNCRTGARTLADGEENEGGNGLTIACCNARFDIIKFLLSIPSIDVNIKTERGTPLMLAYKNGNISVVNLLLSHDVNSQCRVKIDDDDDDDVKHTDSGGLQPASSMISDRCPLTKSLIRQLLVDNGSAVQEL